VPVSLRAAISLWAERLVIAMADRRHLHGIRLAVTTSVGTDSDNLFGRIDQALAVIENAQPRRLVQAKRYFRIIWIRRFALHRAAYAHRLRACILDTAFVADCSFQPEQIAASIVHETIHARLEQCGFPYTWQNKARIERICRRAELDFGLHLRDGEAVIARAVDHLALDDSTLTGTLEAQRHAEVNARVAELSDIEMPRVVRRFLLWVLRRRAT
jgi:hypothetical protein